MSHTEVQSPSRQSPDLSLPPIAVKSYLNSAIETPGRSPRMGLDMSLINSSPDITRVGTDIKQSQSVRGTGRPLNISFDTTISKFQTTL